MTGSAWDRVGGDPVAGDPEAFALWARRFHNAAEAESEALAQLRRLAVEIDQVWVGESADAFRAELLEFIAMVEAEARADDTAGEALGRFGRDLEDLQADARAALRRIGQGDDDAVGRALGGTLGVYGLGQSEADPVDRMLLGRVAEDLRDRVWAAENIALEGLERSIPHLLVTERVAPTEGYIPPPDLGQVPGRAGEIDRLLNGPMSTDNRRHLQALLVDSAAKAGQDPAYATALLARLSVDGARRLLGLAAAVKDDDRRQIAGPLGALLVAANRTADGQKLVTELFSKDTWHLDVLATDLDLDDATAWPLALALIRGDPGGGYGDKEPGHSQITGLDLLARHPDLALRYAQDCTAALMADLARDDARGAAAARVLAVGLGPLTEEQRHQADAALAKVIAAMGHGSVPAPPGKLVVAQLLRARIGVVADQAMMFPEGRWTPGEGFDPPHADLEKAMVPLVADPAARNELLAGSAEYAARQFRDAAKVAVGHLGVNDDGAFRVAFDRAAEHVGHLQGLLAESILDARAHDAAAGKALASVFGTAAKLAVATTDAGPLAGPAVDVALGQVQHAMATSHIPKIDSGPLESHVDDLVAASLDAEMSPDQRAQFLTPPDTPQPFFVDGHLVVPDPGNDHIYQAYHRWLDKQTNFVAKVHEVRQQVMASWDHTLVNRIR